MLKRFLHSMTGRFFLILLGGTIVSGALALALAAFESKDMLNQLRNRHLTERIEQIILMLEAAPSASRQPMTTIASRYGMRVNLAASHASTNLGTEEHSLAAALSQALGSARSISAFIRYDSNCPVRGRHADADAINKCHTVLATLNDGTQLRLDIAAPSDRLPLPFRHDFLPYLILFLICIAALAFLVAQLATKPLRTLAGAAHNLGRNLEHPHLPEDKGPVEVREAAGAFNSMQTQIRQFIEERTYMLAAIAHDLQTPLTRLRLRLEKVGDEELRGKLVHDLALTQDIVKEGMDLARSVDTGEPFELLDLDSLIASICDDATDAGLKVTQSGKIGTPVKVRPNALRRCLANLVDNAVKYGGYANVTLRKEGSRAIISIVDGGPGIPEDQLQNVFKPFQRLEGSRSRGTGGTGLGLTIAANIAQKHRGSLRLRNLNRAGQGLEAIVELPLA